MRSQSKQPGITLANDREFPWLLLCGYLVEGLLIPTGELAPLIQDAEGARRRGH